MSKGFNSCTFIGNLGRDPDIRHSQAGNPVCKFSIAVSTYKDEVKWMNIVIFNKHLIENVIEKYLKKGSRVMLSGLEATPTQWEKDGETKYGFEFQGSFNVQLVLLSGNNNDNAESSAPLTTGQDDDEWS